jgi:hypothetical protein
MKKFTFLPRVVSLLAGVLLAGLAACDGGGGSGVAGPSSGGSFSGSTITINPTLVFGSGGVVTYTNTESGSAFPATDGGGVTGTYVYTPNSNATSGTLVLTLPAPVGVISFTLQNFKVQGGNVTSFEAVYAGRAFSSSVTSGTLPAKSSSGGGSLGANETLATAIPSVVQGVHKLSFHYPENGAPFAENDTVSFTIGASTLQIGAPVNKTLTNPVFRNGSASNWIFKDGAFEYAVSVFEDSLNEINLVGSAGTPFYGQFNNRKRVVME